MWKYFNINIKMSHINTQNQQMIHLMIDIQKLDMECIMPICPTVRCSCSCSRLPVPDACQHGFHKWQRTAFCQRVMFWLVVAFFYFYWFRRLCLYVSPRYSVQFFAHFFCCFFSFGLPFFVLFLLIYLISVFALLHRIWQLVMKSHFRISLN